jgi:uncharacterized protein
MQEAVMQRRIILTCAFVMAWAANVAVAQVRDTDLHGDWRGTLDVGAISLRLVLHLGARSTFDSPDQNAMGLPAQWSVADGKVAVQFSGAGQFEGRLSADGKVLEGIYRQGAASFPLKLARGGSTAVKRPQTPQPPFPYKVEEVSYANAAEPAVRLAATLTTPRSSGPFPAVLLITGSGLQDRDETLFEHQPFAVLADALTRRGIAVLRVDDRGIGGSSAGPASATTASFATDVAAGVAWLRQRKDIDAKRIGLLGHSEGGLIAPLVASGDPGIAFVVMWAGPAVSGKELLIDQVRALAAASGAGAAQAARSGDVQREVLNALLGASGFAASKTAMNAVLARHGAPPASDATVTRMDSAWYRYFLTLDAAPALRAVKVPVLALLGGKDQQVSVALNEAPLRAALAGNPRASVEVLPGLNHLFQAATTGAPSEYSQIEETINPAALDRMVGWMVQVTAGATAR